MKYFTLSFWFTGIALLLSVVVGYYYGGNSMAFSYFISCIMLGILEVAVSIDNAVVNATVLKDMDDKWRHRFLTWGMAIAVFGMRLVFPLAIVSIAGNVNPLEAFNIALFNPAKYQELVSSVHLQVMAFGGTFLFLVFAAHFINHEKDVHWIPGIGHAFSKIGKHSTAKIAIPAIFVLVFSSFVGEGEGHAFLLAAFWGIVTYLAVDGLGDLFEVEDSAGKVGRTGLGAFVYLEFVDASFSFDGVIAAFAITDNFIIIMLGLSIGAMFVRSMTIMLVEKGTLDTFRYLEDGAFWGIGWLVASMYLSVLHIELGEIAVAGGAGLAIVASVVHSMIVNKREAKEALLTPTVHS